MVLVLCANAGVDRTYEVAGFEAGGFHRPERVRVVAGGKGINAARVLHGLGQPVRVAGFAGGLAGAFVVSDLRRAGLEPALTRIGEESRTTLTVVDSRQRRTTRLDEWGPLVSPAEVEALCRQWARLLGETDLAVIAGNPPRGVPRDLYTRLTAEARTRGVPLIADAHEEHLEACLAGGPTVLKINQQELSGLAKRPLGIPEETVAFGRELLAQGLETVVVTLGEDGALLVSADAGAALACPPQVDCLSAVGSGDAALAGYAAARLQGLAPGECLRWAVAAGTANCTKLGAGGGSRADLDSTLRGTSLRTLT